jgi:hypothetical protein
MTTGRINQVAAFPEERAAAKEKRIAKKQSFPLETRRDNSRPLAPCGAGVYERFITLRVCV